MIYWKDVDVEKPEVGRHIFYICKEDIDRFYSETKYSYPSKEDVSIGTYYEGKLVEWHYDMPDIEFKWWSYLPKFS